MNTKVFSAVLVITAFASIAASSNPLKIENSIARLNYAGFSKFSHCTASLITPYSALTAKHCVKTKLHLLFGYYKGTWVEHRKVSNTIQHPTKDIAILCFNERSDQRHLKLLKYESTQNINQISVFGYPRSRAHLLQKKQCEIGKSEGKGILNCALEQGMSGGPVVHIKQNSNALIGIASKSGATSSQIELVNAWVFKNVDGCLPK